MRIVGPEPHPWTVYHAERCAVLYDVVWVDTETKQWAEIEKPLRVVNNEFITQTHQAKRIDIYPESALIIINQLEDTGPTFEEWVDELISIGATL